MQRRAWLGKVVGAASALVISPFSLSLFKSRDVVVRAGQTLIVKAGDQFGKIVVDGGTVIAESRGARIEELVVRKGEAHLDWSDTLYVERNEHGHMLVRENPVKRKRIDDAWRKINAIA